MNMHGAFPLRSDSLANRIDRVNGYDQSMPSWRKVLLSNIRQIVGNAYFPRSGRNRQQVVSVWFGAPPTGWLRLPGA
jgi:hypothetical protein